MLTSRLKVYFPAILVLVLLSSLISISTSKGATGPAVTIVTTNNMTSLNPDVINFNLTINKEIDYFQRANFYYINDKGVYVPNTDLGSYQIVSQTPFRVKYTIKSNRVWSDGTPITAVDLLLHHSICSSRYVSSAALGNINSNPSDLAFKSNCYGGKYGEYVSGLPLISDDKLSLTVEYDRYFPEWLTVGPKPFPVHALVLLSENEKGLKNVATTTLAKERFERAFYNYDSRALSAYGNIWSNSYNIQSVNNSTNPLLLVSSGGYQVQSASPGDRVTLIYNDKYNSGPSVNGIASVIYRVIGDGTSAAQALRNQQVDILSGQPTADTVALLKTIPTARIVEAPFSVYEHLDLRTGTASGEAVGYNGIFEGNSQRAFDLRRAFLLTIPRDEIIQKLIVPVNGSAQRLDSLFYFYSDQDYMEVISNNGIEPFTRSQISREAEALSLVRKHFPLASPTNLQVKVNLLWGTTANTRRSSAAQLIKSAAARAGFDVNAPGVTTWSTQLSSSAWDASFFAWVRQESTVNRIQSMYCSNCGNNLTGWSSSIIDSIDRTVSANLLTSQQMREQFILAEQEIYKNNWSLPLFQHPGVLAVNANLAGLRPSPYSLSLVWNYWEWRLPGAQPFPQYVVPQVQPTASPSASPTTTVGSNKPITPSFSLINFSENKINISVNIGTSASDTPDKVILIAPSLGFTSTNPISGRIEGSTATWSIEFDKGLSGKMIPLVVISERRGVQSDSASASYQIPAEIASSLRAPNPATNLKSRVVGKSVVVTANTEFDQAASPSETYLISKKLGYTKANPLFGDLSGTSALFEIPIKTSMSGKTYRIEIYLRNSAGVSDPLKGNFSAPATAKVPAPKKSTISPKPKAPTTIVCVRTNQTRAFSGSKCPPGWKQA